ncbi:MAG: ATP synthase F0 subunit C [Acutalibacteraceae bacterium]|nr:ATP synthase F0 subunit C [Acutalibacteraceae bacterium]
MKNKKIISIIICTFILITLAVCLSVTAFADEPETDTATQQVSQQAETTEDTEQEDNALGQKALAAAIAVAIAAGGGAIGMGMAIAKSSEGMARQPEASGKINSAMMLGLVFIETLVIYALIVAILIIFVL